MSKSKDDASIISLLTEIKTRLAYLETRVESKVTEVTTRETNQDSAEVQTTNPNVSLTSGLTLGASQDQQPQASGSAASVTGVSTITISRNKTGKQLRSLRRIYNQVRKFSSSSDIPVVIISFHKGKFRIDGSPRLVSKFAGSKDVKEKYLAALQTVDRPLEPVHPSYETQESLSILKKLPAVPVSHLRAVITEALVSPGFTKSTISYKKESPSWWPSEVPFCSVNHPKAGEPRLKREELLKIASSLAQFSGITSCRNGQVSSQMPNEYPSMFEECSERNCDQNIGQDIEQDIGQDAEEEMEQDIGQDHNEGEECTTETASAMLDRVYAIKNWDCFKKAVCNLSIVNLPPTKKQFVDSVNERIDTRFRDRVYYFEGKRVFPVTCHGNGDCLFNAIRISFFGTDAHAALLRISAVKTGITMFAEIADMLLREYPTVSNALAYSSEVLSEDDEFPTSSIPREIIEATLKQGIMALSKNFSDAGLLGVTLISYMIGCSIKVFVDDDYEWLSSFGTEGKSFCILWCKATEESTTLSHFQPLLPLNDRSPRDQSKGKCRNSYNKRIKEKCDAIMWGMCQVRGRDLCDMDDWVQCSVCMKWYHCKCFGLPLHLAEKIVFSCCSGSDGAGGQQLAVFQKVGRLISVKIKLSDLSSLQCHRGLTAGIIDFYFRHLQESCSTHVLICSSTASQIACFKGGIASRLAKHAKEYNVSSEQTVFIFPVCLNYRTQWHWISVAFVSYNGRWICFPMDSLHQGKQHKQTISYLWQFLRLLLGVDHTCHLEYGSTQVSFQEGVDCGVMTVQNIELFSLLVESRPLQELFDNKHLLLRSTRTGRGMRCRIIQLLHNAMT